MASGDRLAFWWASDNHPPSSAFATVDSRNAHIVLDFDAATDEEACFEDIVPPWYGGGSWKVRLFVGMTSAIAGSARWQTDVERLQPGTLDVDSDSFTGTFQSGALTAPATAGIFTWVEITHTNAQIDGCVVGDPFRLKVRRDADGTSGTDDASGDGEIMCIEVVEV